MFKILIMGLPGSGKTTLAKELIKTTKAYWLNADKVRKKYNDWDFSREGVSRQAKRMAKLAKQSRRKVIIADFICPFKKGRKIFNADYVIWMDTVKKGRLPSFDKTFQKPKDFNIRIKTKNAKNYAKQIYKEIFVNL